jgi:hypothetical protein
MARKNLSTETMIAISAAWLDVKGERPLLEPMSDVAQHRAVPDTHLSPGVGFPAHIAVRPDRTSGKGHG